MDFQCPPVDDIIAGMDRCRIEVALLSSLSGLVHTDTHEDNLYVRKLVIQNPNRFRGLAVVTPYGSQRAAEELEICLRDHGFVGLKLHPWVQGYYGGADFLAPLLEICQSHSAPVVFHTGTPPYAQAFHIWVQARKFPRVTFVLAHLGLNYQWRDAIEVGKMCSNTLFDTSGISYTFAVKRAIEELGPERVLFGSDNPFLFPETELQKVVTLGLDATVLQLVLCENARRTFDLPL
jgi:predicted TIM-barrel fold metal-dependent hydrolase